MKVIVSPKLNRIVKVKQTAPSSGGSGAWGGITGTLEDQADLVSALSGKAPALTADENYVTDAEKTVLGNTSGTNTGDQDLSGKGSLDAVQTWTKGQAGEVTALTSTAASIAINLSDSNNFSHTLTENTTLAAPSDPVAGQSGTIDFLQHASAAKTLAYNGFWKFPMDTIPTMNTTVGTIAKFTYSTYSSTEAGNVNGICALCALLKRAT